MNKYFFDNITINERIKNILEKKLHHYKNIKYAYAIMSKRNPARFVVISNRKKWFDVYVKNNFQFIDPVLITALNRLTPFSWDENTVLNHGIKVPKLFNIASKYNIISGYTFVLHDHNNNLVLLSLIIDEECDSCIEEAIHRDKCQLQMVLNTIHENLTTLYQGLKIKSDSYGNSIRGILSTRENEIIYWASVGKTYQEIATILDIKLTTVKYHASNVVKKLGVINIKHAIRLSVELQLIKPILSDMP
ncbi:LuxR family transcriptional regulator [Erwinia sp. Leaf53]|uniref:helix-turn-helix transcriptional regulator n=1 Tax=Erwinia sp. Leaf53 TaxID=1736225 RepID=UPI0006F6261D|nr:LuxR family transcriptional regulator [Erwinia sp. Leaf53]KQN63534.1 LuxR family transcriptional regulator [Erwinia sp. Leaf53]